MTRTPFVCLRSVRRQAPSLGASGILAALLVLAHAPAVLAEGTATDTVAAGLGDAKSDTGDSTGLRSALLSKGIAFGIEVRADSSTTLIGGVRRGTAARGPVLLGLWIDTEALLGWPGGRFYGGHTGNEPGRAA